MTNNSQSYEGIFELVIASKNMHKIQEYRVMLKGLSNIDLLSLADFPSYVPLEEKGSTFEENATAKALHAAQTLNRWVIADDSGLTVPSLGGEPGIYSARYAGSQATDLENQTKLLAAAAHLSEEDRYAYYECVIALASPEGIKKVVKGICEGELAIQGKGRDGFGYDPIFIKHGYHKSFAELGDSVKNRISHRRKALDKLINTLESVSTKPSLREGNL